MALDVQRNWNAAMAQPLKRSRGMTERRYESMKEQAGQQKGKSHSHGIQSSEMDTDSAQHTNPHEQDAQLYTYTPGGGPRAQCHLPNEIIVQILSYVERQRESQHSLASCCLLSRQWYQAAVPLLYAYPRLYGKNFDPFVRAICPSINLHVRKSPLAELVRSLDMGRLVHQGSKSMTARLLGRTKGNLEEFIAPQATFAVNCFPALAKCQRLRFLNLSLVSESPPLPDLLRIVSNLERLTSFELPRSAGFGVHQNPAALTWPPNLQDLTLSGGIDAHFIHGVAKLPPNLRRLTIAHCPLATSQAITHLLKTAVRPLAHLEYLRISQMPRLHSHALDDILYLVPQISYLSIAVDYITPGIFDENMDDRLLPAIHENNIRTLELSSSGASDADTKLHPIHILTAFNSGVLPKLRVVRCAHSMRWLDPLWEEDMQRLVEALEDAAEAEWDAGEGFVDGVEKSEEEREAWIAGAGVWDFPG